MVASRRFVPLVMSMGVALTGCSAAATPAPTAAPVTAAPVTAAPSAAPDGTLPKPELSSIKMGTPIGQFSQFGAVLADQLHLYEKYGVKVTITKFNAGGDSVNALLAGAVDVGADTGAEIGFNSQLTDTPATSVSVEKLGVFDGFFCQASIKTAADLKGKTVGISTFGAAGDASARLALKALGLTATDVTITQVGGSSVRQAALKAGSIACAPISIDQKATETALGLNMLVDLSSNKDAAYPAVGLASTNAWLKKYPNTMLALVAAELEATHVVTSDRATTVAQWAAFLQQTDTVKASADYDAAINQINPDLTWPASGFSFALSVLTSVTPALSTVDPTKAYDASYLKKLNDLGFYKKIGVPYPTTNWP